jgi:hypothetical protein
MGRMGFRCMMSGKGRSMLLLTMLKIFESVFQ